MIDLFFVKTNVSGSFKPSRLLPVHVLGLSVLTSWLYSYIAKYWCSGFVFQGDYIRHPVLYELSHKYGLQQTGDLPDAQLPCKLEELKEAVRREIRKELKIKEGAEKLREVAKDRRSLGHVATIVKNANAKLTELKNELSELESQIILTRGQGPPTISQTNGGKC